MSILDRFIKPPKDDWEIQEYKQFSTLRLVSIIIIGFLVTSFLVGIYFIYQNIYQAIDQAQTIIITKSNLGDEIINFDTLDKVKNAWDLKHLETATTTLKRDPFNLTSTSTSATANTSTIKIVPPVNKNSNQKVQIGV